MGFVTLNPHCSLSKGQATSQTQTTGGVRMTRMTLPPAFLQGARLPQALRLRHVLRVGRWGRSWEAAQPPVGMEANQCEA